MTGDPAPGAWRANMAENKIAARLRKLDGLRRDGLIDEGEFQKKRKEIMEEKW
jgi:hypothetical protein